MKNLDQRNQIIEYSLKLNSTNLSPLRSGNISLRGKENDIEGYLITPSGKKYETLKPEEIVFMGLNDEEEKNEETKIRKSGLLVNFFGGFIGSAIGTLTILFLYINEYLPIDLLKL